MSVFACAAASTIVPVVLSGVSEALPAVFVTASAPPEISLAFHVDRQVGFGVISVAALAAHGVCFQVLRSVYVVFPALQEDAHVKLLICLEREKTYLN